tara:strand:- start:785 stop:1270 length:486 start_codon:yes stop_codon:yes gene_type:complete
MFQKNNLLDLLITNKCIYYGNDIKLSSGKIANIYYDIKKAAGIPEVFEHIIKELKNIIPEHSSIVSVSTGGISYGAVLASIYKTSFAYVRENEKQYGMKNIVEGFIDINKPIYIIDDVCTTGKSIINAKNAIGHYNNTCSLVCIVDRSNIDLDIKSIIKIK